MRDEQTEKLGREIAAEARRAAVEADLVVRGDERGYVKREGEDGDH